ncbi:hypothetical protein TRICI_006911 [Trichomonascus ciferrii]|uniref:Protein LTV1 n=1 Tax=Trichomonascus ciferrii TaxID=44093 RepID=A0A642UBP5_9ASCO|nr:hypothetical protein TRICI_006911 [Trichomonascus ciferrii]
MGPKRWIDKKNAQTYTLLHRSHEDPLYNDPEAAERVFVKTDNLNSASAKTERKNKWTGSKGKTISDLEEHVDEFKKEGWRENEGEAALYGITYDDSKYDYMQHLKPMGQDPNAIFIAKKDLDRKPKGGIEFKEKSQLPEDVLPSKETVKRTYQDQQNLPDALAGLQPDMDPNLREVLEALEDEEFVEEGSDEDELFGTLVKSGERETDEWDDFDADDYSDLDGNVSDDTVTGKTTVHVEPREGEEEWETAFRKFKIEQEKSRAADDSDDDDNLASEAGDGLGPMTDFSVATGTTRRGRRKRRGKGARTEMTGLSMSSSAMVRNEGLTLLDDRFDKIEEEYEDEEEEEPGVFDMKNERPDLEDALDDFLENYVVDGKKLYKKK